MRISDWSSDVCSSDLDTVAGDALARGAESTASVTNDAEATVASGVAEAGNDVIFANADTLGDVIAGDAASSDAAGGNATVKNDAFADNGGDATAEIGRAHV